MSVLLMTSAGDLVIDVFTDDCPLASKNFLKLCKLKYYNGCLFYNVQQNLLAQTGDPTGTGKGGVSVYGKMYGEQADTFKDEMNNKRKLNKVGMVCMAKKGDKEDSNTSQFFITLRGEDLKHIESTHTIFGEVMEGEEVLQKLNNLYCDGDGRPYQDLRILHTYLLDDPFDDPAQLDELIPPESPQRSEGRDWPDEERVKQRLPYTDPGAPDVHDGRSAEEIDESIRRKDAMSRAIVLEMTGDLPDADVKPPDEVLFVCKLNRVTTDEDLELIFSRFGTIKSCEIASG
jgi:peptidyl-prolyl cis-trans isomerase-like 4